MSIIELALIVIAATGTVVPAPTPTPTNPSNSGRVTGVVVDPSDPSGNTIYIGTASGGVWKTTNGG